RLGPGGQRNAERLAAQDGGAVEQLEGALAVHGGDVREPPERPATGGWPGAGLQREQRENLVGKPGTQPPAPLEVARRGAARQPWSAGRAGAAGIDGGAQVRAGIAVAGSLAAQLLGELADGPVLGAVGARERELAAHVDQDLVAARRCALEQLVERLAGV